MKRVFQNHKDSSKWVTKTQDTCLPSPFSLIQTLQRQTVFQSKSIKDKLSNQNNQELVSEDSVHTLHWYVILLTSSSCVAPSHSGRTGPKMCQGEQKNNAVW